MVVFASLFLFINTSNGDVISRYRFKKNPMTASLEKLQASN